MACVKDMYFDPGTGSCAYCSELCFSVDIQGTREECIKRCPGYLAAREIELTSPLSAYTDTADTTQLTSMHASTVEIIIIACLAVLSLVGFMLVLKRKYIIKRIKRQDCCSDGLSSQPHVQEIGASPAQANSLLNNQGYPDLPHTISYSFRSHGTRV